MKKRLVRNTTDKMISGVCAGIADYFNIDTTIVRLIWALFVVFGFGSGILVYIVCAIVIPKDIDVF